MCELKQGSEIFEKVAKVENDINHIKEDIKDLKERQTGSEDSIKELTVVMREQNAKQDATNKYIEKLFEKQEEFMEKMVCNNRELIEIVNKKVDTYQEKNEKKFSDLEIENSNQNNDKSNKIIKAMWVIVTVVSGVLAWSLKTLWELLPLIK